MSKYAEQNVDSTSKNILAYVFAPLIIIALISGLAVWVVNASEKAREKEMVAYCVRSMNSYYYAFKDKKTVYQTTIDDVTFIGDSDKYHRGSGFTYKFSVSRAVSNYGREVYGIAYVRVSNKVATLMKFVVFGDANELDSLRATGKDYIIRRL
jgi:hypothetical protein